MSFGNLQHHYTSMKSLLITVLFLFFHNGRIYAQSDSMAVSKANWKKEKIANGVLLKTYCFNKTLFNSNQNVSVLEIKQKNSLLFDLGYDSRILIKTSDFGKQNNALAALNGTFFDIANGGSVDYIRADGGGDQ